LKYIFLGEVGLGLVLCGHRTCHLQNLSLSIIYIFKIKIITNFETFLKDNIFFSFFCLVALLLLLGLTPLLGGGLTIDDEEFFKELFR